MLTGSQVWISLVLPLLLTPPVPSSASINALAGTGQPHRRDSAAASARRSGACRCCSPASWSLHRVARLPGVLPLPGSRHGLRLPPLRIVVVSRSSTPNGYGNGSARRSDRARCGA
ncbi:hypothetical protein AAHA92_01077 [Salvia divinorum]|uniref:Secreted protein n=1 Tax=Salvia divinorum TaxID=28513 RepID=A0ABD1IPV3_SALDI